MKQARQTLSLPYQSPEATFVCLMADNVICDSLIGGADDFVTEEGEWN